MTEQRQLDYDPAPVRLPLPDPRVVREARPRLKRLAALVLGRLMQGRATTTELVAITARFSARILELRRAGHDIVRVREVGDDERGIFVYELRNPGGAR